MSYESDVTFLDNFAKSIGCVFVTHGEVGFGRPCVGILEPNVQHYLDYNPMDYSTDDWTYIFPEDKDLDPSDNVFNAYHKHSCFSVLVHDDNYEEATAQLRKWIEEILEKGVVGVAKHGEVDLDSMDDIESLFTPPYKVALVYKEKY